MNLNELNKVMSDEIYKLRAGKAKSDRTNAISRAASVIVAAGRLEWAHLNKFGPVANGSGLFPTEKVISQKPANKRIAKK